MDLLVCWLMWIAIAMLWYGIIRPGEEPLGEATLSWFAFLYLYLAVLKGTPVRTIGFRVAGVKIVDFRGQQPSMLRMTLRFLLWIVGPINLVIDWLWLSSDPHKQCLRDKFAGTYVVRAKAEPPGASPRKARYYNVFGLMFVFLEIQPREPAAE